MPKIVRFDDKNSSPLNVMKTRLTSLPRPNSGTGRWARGGLSVRILKEYNYNTGTPSKHEKNTRQTNLCKHAHFSAVP